MPFAYFERLSRRQQGIYLKSDRISAVPLPDAPALRPLVVELGSALESGDRALTETASQRLASALSRELGLPSVRVTVLAARPHAKWGELHGLYESTGKPRTPSIITLWMRTARQKRVVAFRTFLRTLLHEMGHHLDYTLLKLEDSLHTQGFYQRESHLFHQLVTDGGPGMATLEATRAHGADGRRLRGRHQGRTGCEALEAARRQELVGQGSALPRARHRGSLHDALPERARHGRAQVPARGARSLGG